MPQAPEALPTRVDVLILGGGIIGSSLAWALAARGVGDIAVIDLDLSGLYASSELNAGGARATWWQPVNIESCRQTLDFFADNADELGFSERGYLWLYDDPDLYARAQRVRELQNGYGLEIESLAAGELPDRFPLLDRSLDEIVGATFSPRDGLVNPNAVRQRYRAEAEAAGVRFCNRHYAVGVETDRVAGSAGSLRRVAAVEAVELVKTSATGEDDAVRQILTRHRVPGALTTYEHRVECGVLVNCLGAWSSILAAKIGIPDVSEPVRRQIALVDVHTEDLAEGVQLDEVGMIVDASGLYLHPEGSHILAGYSTPDEAPGFDFHYDGEAFFADQIWPRLAHRMSSFERCGHVRGWAGLYAVTPDCSGIADRVEGFSNLFEAHAFTGRGVMQSYAVGRAMAALITTGRYEDVDLSVLSRSRFADRQRWVLEELHI
jgi:glycine/D-amino acid oxidase-like deaminating enzyme